REPGEIEVAAALDELQQVVVDPLRLGAAHGVFRVHAGGVGQAVPGARSQRLDRFTGVEPVEPGAGKGFAMLAVHWAGMGSGGKAPIVSPGGGLPWIKPSPRAAGQYGGGASRPGPGRREMPAYSWLLVSILLLVPSLVVGILRFGLRRRRSAVSGWGGVLFAAMTFAAALWRSEERRVGKECRSRGSPSAEREHVSG